MELQVALNFLISFLYNKLPRRRVNHFGEELEKALQVKFQGHWYPDQPFKGSAYRCVKTTPPLDPVFAIAARESGVDIRDIEENLPQELSIWIDPGEVSYQMSEKGPVKVLYSESNCIEERSDREVIKTFNPEAQCFKPVDALTQQLNGLQVEDCLNCSPTPNPNCERCDPSFSSGSSPSSSYKSVSPTPPNFLNKSAQPLTFTTASFAQTKFGSTKLKSNAKRNNGTRMSSTEFSNYIKQRAIAQQAAQQQLSVMSLRGNISPMFERPRSLSPHPSSFAAEQPMMYTGNVGSLYPSNYPADFARSPTRTRSYTMQTRGSPNHLSVSVPHPLGSSLLSTSAGNVSSTSPSPPSSNGDYTEFSIPYSSTGSHQLLVASN
ncbi:protein Tob1 [Galendromus occidentalis]|uniref:Protein Tob1 n=1 Tax=Galendromus occidentalis TaxID=34638 RepID=A0AAJ6QUN3_9ACAR|nr:protein Tob1 [Galendromus occidentalis]